MAGATWALTVDMTGVEYWEGFQLIPSGPYEVELSGAEPNIEEGKTTANSISISASVVGGPHTPKYAGKTTDVYLGTNVEKEGVRRQWLSFGLSLGMDAAKIANKKIEFSPKTLLDKDGKRRHAYVFVQNPPKDANGMMPSNRTDRRFISKEHYEKLLTQKWPDDVDGVRLAPKQGSGNGAATGGGAKPATDFTVAPAGGVQAQTQPQAPTPTPTVAQAPAAEDGF